MTFNDKPEQPIYASIPEINKAIDEAGQQFVRYGQQFVQSGEPYFGDSYKVTATKATLAKVAIFGEWDAAVITYVKPVSSGGEIIVDGTLGVDFIKIKNGIVMEKMDILLVNVLEDFKDDLPESSKITLSDVNQPQEPGDDIRISVDQLGAIQDLTVRAILS